MATNQLNNRVNRLFEQENWQMARTILEKEQARHPGSHWVLTQIAVTYYEERRYLDALKVLLDSLKIKKDCPLTIWNLAGTLACLGRHDDSRDLYLWILKSKKSTDDDPCWETATWTKSLKSDCLVRLGDLEKDKGNPVQAAQYYREYLARWARGEKGTYSTSEVDREVQSVGPISSAKLATSGKVKGSGLKVMGKFKMPRAVGIQGLLRTNQNAWIQVSKPSQIAYAIIVPQSKPKQKTKSPLRDLK